MCPPAHLSLGLSKALNIAFAIKKSTLKIKSTVSTEKHKKTDDDDDDDDIAF